MQTYWVRQPCCFSWGRSQSFMGKKSHSCVPLDFTYSTTAPDKPWVGLELG